MATQPVSHEHDELVDVFETMDEPEALVVKGLLESAGIPALMTGEVPLDVLPGVGGLIIRVPAEQAVDARALIEQSGREPLTDCDVTDEATPEQP